jgi:hypothetical protein
MYYMGAAYTNYMQYLQALSDESLSDKKGHHTNNSQLSASGTPVNPTASIRAVDETPMMKAEAPKKPNDPTAAVRAVDKTPSKPKITGKLITGDIHEKFKGQKGKVAVVSGEDAAKKKKSNSSSSTPDPVPTEQACCNCVIL